jgi:hypothetical protein
MFFGLQKIITILAIVRWPAVGTISTGENLACNRLLLIRNAFVRLSFRDTPTALFVETKRALTGGLRTLVEMRAIFPWKKWRGLLNSRSKIPMCIAEVRFGVTIVRRSGHKQ